MHEARRVFQCAGLVVLLTVLCAPPLAARDYCWTCYFSLTDWFCAGGKTVVGWETCAPRKYYVGSNCYLKYWGCNNDDGGKGEKERKKIAAVGLDGSVLGATTSLDGRAPVMVRGTLHEEAGYVRSCSDVVVHRRFTIAEAVELRARTTVLRI
jgi:hypothetical protein